MTLNNIILTILKERKKIDIDSLYPLIQQKKYYKIGTIDRTLRKMSEGAESILKPVKLPDGVIVAYRVNEVTTGNTEPQDGEFFKTSDLQKAYNEAEAKFKQIPATWENFAKRKGTEALRLKAIVELRKKKPNEYIINNFVREVDNF